MITDRPSEKVVILGAIMFMSAVSRIPAVRVVVIGMAVRPAEYRKVEMRAGVLILGMRVGVRVADRRQLGQEDARQK